MHDEEVLCVFLHAYKLVSVLYSIEKGKGDKKVNRHGNNMAISLNVDENIRKEYLAWAASPLLRADERAELEKIGCDEELLLLSFGGRMSFGTAGLRAGMGMGTNRMNRFTVAQTTEGIARLVCKAGGEARGVAIAYDSRHHSAEFAETAASVLAANGIRVY